MSSALEYDLVVVLESTRTAQDFDNWNATQNTCGIKTTDECAKYPKSMLRAAVVEFNDWAREHYLDASKYPFVEINEENGRYQVDFHVDRDASSARVSMYDIIFDSRRRRILEWEMTV